MQIFIAKIEQTKNATRALKKKSIYFILTQNNIIYNSMYSYKN